MADLEAIRRESEERARHLEFAVSEIQRLSAELAERQRRLDALTEESNRWRTSVWGRVAALSGRANGFVRPARRVLGRLTGRGTVLYRLGLALLPRRFARWLRRIVAPLPAAVGAAAPSEPSLPGSARPRSRAAAPTYRRQAFQESIPRGEYDVVVFSIIDWDFRFQRPQHIATQFGKHGHRVFFLSTTRFLDDGNRWSLSRKAHNVWELALGSPRSLDVYGGRLVGPELAALRANLADFAEANIVGDAVCIVQVPFWRPLGESMRERCGWRVVYDCMDEWTNFPGIGAPVLDVERGLVQSADLTVVSAERLREKWGAEARELRMVPNGVDVDYYRIRYGPNHLLDDLAHPVIGYYGALASWVDVDLLVGIARKFPNGTLVLAGGHFDLDVAPLRDLPNVRLLGQRPYYEMPMLLWNFDACVIPFLVNAITEATNPVKFYEYLFSGKPVIAPDLTELRPYRDLAYLASDRDDFIEKLGEALREPADDPRRAARHAMAQANDWKHRYRALDDGIRRHFPRVSVVIATFNRLDLTQACLDSLLHGETWPSLEVIVVDNGSSDGTPEYLQGFARTDGRLQVVPNPKNEGFAAANNAGTARATGDFVIFLNNDTIVPPGMIGRLVRHLEADPRIGLVCPTTNFCGNEAKVDPGYAELDEMPAYAAWRAFAFEGRTLEIGVAAMYCVAARKEILTQVGPLDENFGIGMFEDDDLAIRMRNAGYRVVCAEDAYVHHYGQGSFSKLPPEEYERIWQENQAYFEKKWGIRWKAHRVRSGVSPVASRVGA